MEGVKQAFSGFSDFSSTASTGQVNFWAFIIVSLLVILIGITSGAVSKMQDMANDTMVNPNLNYVAADARSKLSRTYLSQSIDGFKGSDAIPPSAVLQSAMAQSGSL